MGFFLIILSIVLILLSFILLFITPFAFLGIILGFFCIIYGRNYKKRPQRLKISPMMPSVENLDVFLLYNIYVSISHKLLTYRAIKKEASRSLPLYVGRVYEKSRWAENLSALLFFLIKF